LLHGVPRRSDGTSAVNWQSYIDSGKLHPAVHRDPVSPPLHSSFLRLAELADIDGRQEATIPTPSFPATYLKVKILSSHADFVAVKSFEVFA
jgi:hypothetical protein